MNKKRRFCGCGDWVPKGTEKLHTELHKQAETIMKVPDVISGETSPQGVPFRIDY